MLEARCGTGNYSVPLIENGIKKLTFLDAGMLIKAKSKLFKYKDRVVEVRQHQLPDIPFADEMLVSFIQVLHHLDACGKDDKTPPKYPNLKETLAEAYFLFIDHVFRDSINGFCPGMAQTLS